MQKEREMKSEEEKTKRKEGETGGGRDEVRREGQ